MGLRGLLQKQEARLAFAWLLPCIMLAVQWLFWDALAPFPLLLFHVSAFFAALIAGLWGGLGATAIALVLVCFFVLPPQFSLALARSSDLLAITIFGLSGVSFSLLLHRLVRSAETARALFDYAGDGIAVIDDGQGRFIDLNTRHAALLGHTREELIGSKVSDYVLDFASATHTDLTTQMQGSGAATFERSLRRADGSTLAVEVTVTPMRDNRILAVVHDISHRRIMEDALRASEERLRLALEATNEGWWDWNVAADRIITNDLWFFMLGIQPGDLTPSADAWRHFLHPDDAPWVLHELDNFLHSSRDLYSTEHRIVTHSGEVRWHHSIGKVSKRDAAGRPLRIVGSNTDITERKLAEQQLRDSEERFRLVVENSPNAIGIWDESARLRYVSPAITEIYSFSPQEMLARSALMSSAVGCLDASSLTPARAVELGVAHLTNLHSWLEIMQQVRLCAQRPGERVVVEQVTQTQGHGERVLQFIHQGFVNSVAGREVVTILHDVTEHRRLEQLLRDSNVELERQVVARTAELDATVAELQRANAGKDAFMAAISHELRTPLTGILGFSETLATESRGPLNEDQSRYVQAIHKSGERLLATVNSVLRYTSVMAGAIDIQRQPCRLIELAAVAMRTVRPEAERKQQLMREEIEPVDLQVESDGKNVVNILEILLDNASKFTPNGGSITLTAARAPGDAAVQITVADTGISMDEAQVSNLFRPFSQVDLTLARRFGGLGLNLACAHQLVKLLGGTIDVESEPGQGSRFTITLPLHWTPGVIELDPARGS